MASICKDPNGTKRILFVDQGGNRKSIRLGKVSLRNAEAVKYRVEEILQSRITNQAIGRDTSSWLAEIPITLADKLAKVGLIESRNAKDAIGLQSVLDDYMASRTDLKPASLEVYGHTVRNLIDHFGADRAIDKITPGDADEFKRFLKRENLASSTVRKRLEIAKALFRSMQRQKLIAENPFQDVSQQASGMAAKQRFVTVAETQKLIEVCPNHHWQMIVALCRFGGLRCPSEVLSLRWQDVLWDVNKIIVTSPKTEHHPDKATRTIPLFPELKPYLDQSFEQAEDGAEFVVDSVYRKSAMKRTGWKNSNLRTTFTKIIKRAGLAAWPRPFHNLRASRETELIECYPIQVVTDWLGNTPSIAMKHYLMTTEEHFQRAIETVIESSHSEPKAVIELSKKSGAESSALDANLAQNRAQHSFATNRSESKMNRQNTDKNKKMQRPAIGCETLHFDKADGEGFEPPVELPLRRFSKPVP